LAETFKETKLREISDLSIDYASEQSSIASYFETINRGNFEATATLFAEEGKLCPPFEKAIIGKEAIAQYLKAEAKGMKLQVDKSTFTRSDDNLVEVIAKGKVFTSLFSVNVAWQFSLNRSGEILAVKIDLLASAQDLLKLKK
jgi:hypothetical protein